MITTVDELWLSSKIICNGWSKNWETEWDYIRGVVLENIDKILLSEEWKQEANIRKILWIPEYIKFDWWKEQFFKFPWYYDEITTGEWKIYFLRQMNGVEILDLHKLLYPESIVAIYSSRIIPKILEYVVKELWIVDLSSLNRLKNVLSTDNLENLVLVSKNANIKEVDNLVKLFRIISDSKIENLSLIINNANIKELEDLLLLKRILEYSEPKNLSLIINHLNITNPKDLRKLEYILRYTNSEYLKFYIQNNEEQFKYFSVSDNHYEEKSTDLVSFMNYFLSKDDFILHNFKPNWELGEDYEWFILWKSKKPRRIKTKFWWYFNLINRTSDSDLNQKLDENWKTSEWTNLFYPLKSSKSLYPVQQQLINRIFAPFFPMVHILELNWGYNFFSTDINNKDFKEHLKFQNLDDDIFNIFRLMYQFLLLDRDHIALNKDHKDRNILDNTIYDFDYSFIGREKDWTFLINESVKDIYEKTLEMDFEKVSKLTRKIAELFVFIRWYSKLTCI